MPYNPTVEELIKRLRLNILVHSYLYYIRDDPIITDHQWQEMANKLCILQSVFGLNWNCYDEAFADWDGSTGMHLPFDEWVQAKAHYLQRQFGE